ncbi:MAG: DUF983 domain-containing protein [Acidimicrobiales bacterium]|nr:DUF983 domain-containing protein [Acidimicrobiia bacterium]NNC81105.1 DUF983 domain-containing protein [Acidimicrobiales bacterium]RZV46150.1 MAG: DUF983 domain-containing protein [Acidimicrobiales bacterium]
MFAQPESNLTVLGRGVRGRCAVCNENHRSHALWRSADRCPRCEFPFERREGQFVGAVGINTILTFFILLVVLVGGIFATWPDIAVIPVIVLTLAVAVIVPFLLLPFSHTIWNSIDLVMDPLKPGEIPGSDD